MKDVFKFIGSFVGIFILVSMFVFGVVSIVFHFDKREELIEFAEYKIAPGESISTFYYCGHTYILYDGQKCCSLLHSPNCECLME